jgi:hypothetical protein
VKVSSRGVIRPAQALLQRPWSDGFPECRSAVLVALPVRFGPTSSMTLHTRANGRCGHAKSRAVTGRQHLIALIGMGAELLVKASPLSLTAGLILQSGPPLWPEFQVRERLSSRANLRHHALQQAQATSRGLLSRLKLHPILHKWLQTSALNKRFDRPEPVCDDLIVIDAGGSP